MKAPSQCLNGKKILEEDLRRRYVASAEDEIVERFETASQDQLDRDFPTDTLWGRTAREIYQAHNSRISSSEETQVFPAQN